MKGDIVTHKDVIHKVAKDLGYSDIVVSEIFEQSVEFIRELAFNSNSPSIKIPSLGTLYFDMNAWLVVKYRGEETIKRGLIIDPKQKELFEAHRGKFEKLELWEKKMWEAGHLLKSLSKHRRRRLVKTKKHTGEKSFEEIEKIQNNYAENEED